MFSRKLESNKISSLRKSSNNLLDTFTLLSDVVQRFNVETPSTNYDHF